MCSETGFKNSVRLSRDRLRAALKLNINDSAVMVPRGFGDAHDADIRQSYVASLLFFILVACLYLVISGFSRYLEFQICIGILLVGCPITISILVGGICLLGANFFSLVEILTLVLSEKNLSKNRHFLLDSLYVGSLLFFILVTFVYL